MRTANLSKTRFVTTHQEGYILPFVLVLLVALMVGSMGFFNRATDSTQLSSASRDYEQALLLAESSGEWVFGRIISDSASDMGCSPAATFGDFNCDGTADDTQIVPDSFTPAGSALRLGYAFYLREDVLGTMNASGVPGILQMVADGEARASEAGGFNSVINNNAVLPGSVAKLRVNDLFVSNTIHPIMLWQGVDAGRNGLHRSVNGATWNTETAVEKAAVWLEVTRSRDALANANRFDIYLATVAQVGNAKAYLQRWVATFSGDTLNTAISPIAEASNTGGIPAP